ncbi:MAG TPA: amino acid adenylation domain-containing protein, partial [Rugosimonospora sp.]|nr:amino acid adenylation domain-containing protein [Rugosimonospora sp.]
ERGADFIGAALGTWLAGAAYLPLDPGSPRARLRAVLEDARPSVVLCSAALAGTAPATGATELVVDPAARYPGPPPAVHPAPAGDPDAYVIYTSGTTGQPKGVVVGHRALGNLVRWHVRAYGVGRGDRALHTAGLGFDAAVWEIWPYLACGAAVVVCTDRARVIPAGIARQLTRDSCTVAFVVTPLAEELLLDRFAPGPLRYLLTGGDRLRLPAAVAGGYRLVNHYGPTEATVVTTAHTVRETGGAPPIGRPITGASVVLVDGHGNEAAPGATGEICIGGRGLARCYLGRPDLTAQRFVTLPGRDGRWYRTGDLAARDGGLLHFQGRVDREQLKIRGVRVEAGDIEAALLRVRGLTGAAVAVVGEGADAVLAALVVTADSELRPRDIRAELATALPRHLMPTRYVRVPRLPLTPNGKLDRVTVAELVRGGADPVPTGPR